jgi:hypothetical protein
MARHRMQLLCAKQAAGRANRPPAYVLGVAWQRRVDGPLREFLFIVDERLQKMAERDYTSAADAKKIADHLVVVVMVDSVVESMLLDLLVQKGSPLDSLTTRTLEELIGLAKPHFRLSVTGDDVADGARPRMVEPGALRAGEVRLRPKPAAPTARKSAASHASHPGRRGRHTNPRDCRPTTRARRHGRASALRRHARRRLDTASG